MPPKGSSAGRSAARVQQLAEARLKVQEAHPTDLQALLAASEAKLSASEKNAAALESALHVEQQQSAELLKALDAERENSAYLARELHAAREKAKKLHQQLRVEHRARQRGQARKGVLEKQISLLKTADLETSDHLKSVKSNASRAITALMKVERENSILRSELSLSLERCRAEVKKSQYRMLLAGKKLRASRRLASNLQRSYARSQKSKELAIEKAKTKILKERSVHNLFHKGVYTEETRNLIRLLVKAGCSREYVSKVVHAVFKTAGISVTGNISRRTVSRVIVEGYYAAQVQLGYEMENTKCMYSYNNLL